MADDYKKSGLAFTGLSKSEFNEQRARQDELLGKNKDISSELKEHLDTHDKIDNLVSKLLKTEARREAILKNSTDLAGNLSKEKHEEVSKNQEALNLSYDMEQSVRAQLSGVTGMVKGARNFITVLMTNPMIAIAAAALIVVKALISMGKAALETRKELGLSLTASAGLVAQTELLGLKAKVWGGTVDDIKEAQTALRRDLGLSVQDAANLSYQFAKTAALTGQSEDQLGSTLSIMESISDSSREALLSQIEMTGTMLEQKGLAPGDIFKDVADNAEHFASFAKDGGANIFAAAGAAKQLGLNMSAVASTTEALLDFETSIEKQMEASMLLGRQINLDRARQLALSGDQEGMMQEVLKQVGGEAEFNRLNVLQRRALAESVGQSVENLSRLVRNNTATTTAGTVAGKKDNSEKVLTDHTELFQSMDKSLKTVADEI